MNDETTARWHALHKMTKGELLVLHAKLMRETGRIQVSGVPFHKLNKQDMVSSILWIEGRS